MDRKCKETSTEVKNIIINHFLQGNSENGTSEMVQKPRTTIHYRIKKCKSFETVGNPPRNHPWKEPHIFKKSRRARLEFAKKYVSKPGWMFFSQINPSLISLDVVVKCWYVENQIQSLRKEIFVPTVKHCGGGVMLWGCEGRNLVPIEGIVNQHSYIDILKENLR
ncbi:hypothetical protein NPIL_467171 [Nephila pilipes]|uniref:Transposable element Tc1 transposase n=1 Tax=Nephila pilipes TaxID=299642 RepID=A0A8X6KIE4_NEPPI|nr:hypothetical protein NPIL_467171 [Nephila pilipes]